MKNLKRLVYPVMLLGVIACANEPEVTEVGPVTTEAEVATAESAVEAHDWWVYTDWDVDANAEVSRREFDERWQTGFAEWDVDGDGALGPDEAADTFRDFFDGNDDNIIDEDEWNAGVDRWAFDGVDWGTWDAWDADANAEVTETEWREVWSDTVWSGWDADGDGIAGRDELADTFWDFFDGNDDDIVDASEWGNQD